MNVKASSQQRLRSKVLMQLTSFAALPFVSLLVQTEGLLGPLRNIEMPLVRVLAGMEDAGIAIDVAALRSVRVSLGSLPVAPPPLPPPNTHTHTHRMGSGLAAHQDAFPAGDKRAYSNPLRSCTC